MQGVPPEVGAARAARRELTRTSCGAPERAAHFINWLSRWASNCSCFCASLGTHSDCGCARESCATASHSSAIWCSCPIVYGLLALGLFVYAFGLGQSVQTAGLTLALLILPVVIVATREAIRSIPGMIREGAYAVGATRWQTVKDHIIPYSTPGILTGVIIGMSRAIGETAPIITIGALTFIAFLPPPPVTGDFPFLSFEWLSAPFTVMPIQMFNWTSRPDPAFHANAAAAGTILVFMTLAMNALAIWLRFRLRKNIKW